MNKKILLSLGMIGATAAIVIGATTAFFSDRERSPENVLQAGLVDIEVDVGKGFENPLVSTSISEKDLKPSWWRERIIRIHNAGNNPVHVWKHVTGIIRTTALWSEPKCTALAGKWNNATGQCVDYDSALYEKVVTLDQVMDYETLITKVYSGEKTLWEGKRVVVDNTTLSGVKSRWQYIGRLLPSQVIVIRERYHIRPVPPTPIADINAYQGEGVTFDINFYSQQEDETGKPMPGVPGDTVEIRGSYWDGSTMQPLLEEKIR